MAKIDHHLHTSRYSPDSDMAPRKLVESAKRAGLDVVVITEHDHQWEADELATINREAGGLIVLSGAEISTREGHFLVYGLPDLDEVPVGVSLAGLLAAVKRHRAAVVAAHPFRWDQDFEGIVDQHGAVFDGVELLSNNVTPETRKSAETLLARRPMMATGSSDGHQPEVVGCYFTEFSGEIKTMADFVAALKAGKGRPRHREGTRLACGRAD
jgi:predicted metal-dependent phosphoesterase TrpH